jgi:hypothetical protein
MKKILKIAVIITIGIPFTSCIAVKKSATTDYVFIEGNNIVVKPQIADLKIEERKVEGSAEIRTQDYRSALNPNAPVEACKLLALKNATQIGKCDLIVQPIFESEENELFVKVRVVGFAAHYKNFRDITAADTLTFQTLKRIKTVVPVEVVTPRSSLMKR